MILTTMIAFGQIAAAKMNSVEPFPLSEVILTGGPFKHSQDIEWKYLLTLEPERLLHNFRKNAGLTPKAPIYGGWEDSGLAGHSLGHYLTACSQAWATSGGDRRFREKIDAVVAGLAECQAHRPDGMISAIPNGDKPWDEIRLGHIKTGGFDLNGMWSPWYTHHKVMMGLLDAHSLAESTQALEVAKKFGDWMIDLTKNLTDEQWQKMLACEYGGMNEALAELYHQTGEIKYLTLSKKFYDHRVLDPLSDGKDILAGHHSNTQVPKILGLARLSEVEYAPQNSRTAKFFWQTVVDHHTYAIGGNSDHEYFTAPDKLSDELTTNTAETCCTYNMLKLTRKLFEWEPMVEYLDFYERAHVNQILSSQDPDSAMVTYFFPLQSGAKRTYSNPENDFTCCHGSGMENHTKHQDSVYFHRGLSELFVAQFIPTDLFWAEAGFSMTQETDYPASGHVKLRVTEAPGTEINVQVRQPGWAEKVQFRLNGNTLLDSTAKGSFVSLRRIWHPGDVVEFDLPMTLRSEPIVGNPNKVAIFRGPVVMAADLGSKLGDDFLAPVLVPSADSVASHSRSLGDGAFQLDSISRPGNLVLKPLYEIVHNHYAVYFDVFSKDQWAKAELAFRAEETRLRDLESRTIDLLRVGEMQPERDHQLTSEKCDLREVNNRGYRTPMAGGHFEFELKADPSKPCELVVTYWINDRWNREGKLLINGTEIAQLDSVNTMTHNSFQDVTYSLSPAILNGTDRIKVRFEGASTKNGASVARVRTVASKLNP